MKTYEVICVRPDGGKVSFAEDTFRAAVKLAAEHCLVSVKKIRERYEDPDFRILDTVQVSRTRGINQASSVFIKEICHDGLD